MLHIWTQEAAILVPGKKGEGIAFLSGSAPRALRPLLNEGLGVPSPPRAGCLLPSHYSDLLSGTWPPKASWGCGFQARLGALWTLPIQGEEELHRRCLLPSAVRLFWCKLKILQELCVKSPQLAGWDCSRSSQGGWLWLRAALEKQGFPGLRWGAAFCHPAKWPPLGLGSGSSGGIGACGKALCSTSLALRQDTSCSPIRTAPACPIPGAWLLAS